jgi:hypothetical protein
MIAIARSLCAELKYLFPNQVDLILGVLSFVSQIIMVLSMYIIGNLVDF